MSVGEGPDRPEKLPHRERLCLAALRAASAAEPAPWASKAWSDQRPESRVPGAKHTRQLTHNRRSGPTKASHRPAFWWEHRAGPLLSRPSGSPRLTCLPGTTSLSHRWGWSWAPSSPPHTRTHPNHSCKPGPAAGWRVETQGAWSREPQAGVHRGADPATPDPRRRLRF